jgi:hypothetical protein
LCSDWKCYVACAFGQGIHIGCVCGVNILWTDALRLHALVKGGQSRNLSIRLRDKAELHFYLVQSGPCVVSLVAICLTPNIPWHLVRTIDSIRMLAIR